MVHLVLSPVCMVGQNLPGLVMYMSRECVGKSIG